MEERSRLPLGAHGTKESNTIPASTRRRKTIRYTQDRVHDFAWFADKRFIVRKSSVTLAKSGRKVDTWVLFTPKNALLWSDAVNYVNESVRLYSKWAGDYPDACLHRDRWYHQRRWRHGAPHDHHHREHGQPGELG